MRGPLTDQAEVVSNRPGSNREIAWRVRDAGTRLVWVIDPETGSAAAYRPHRTVCDR
jgi:hypothetical protein